MPELLSNAGWCVIVKLSLEAGCLLESLITACGFVTEKGSPLGELAPVRATERGLQFLRLIVITTLRLDKLGTSPQGEAFFVACGFVQKKT